MSVFNTLFWLVRVRASALRYRAAVLSRQTLASECVAANGLGKQELMGLDCAPWQAKLACLGEQNAVPGGAISILPKAIRNKPIQPFK